MTAKQFLTDPEQQLAAMRRGKDQDLTIKAGDLEIPCRILNAQEEAATIATAKLRARKSLPEGVDPAVHESAEVMRSVLLKATNLKNVQYLGTKFLNALSSGELDALYDQYITLQRTVVFEQMTTEKIAELILAVKKKEKAPSDCFTWELAAIGRSFWRKSYSRATYLGADHELGLRA
jgi:hypothetical protein